MSLYLFASRSFSLTFIGVLVSGCISSTPMNESGVRIGDETLTQFKAGVTTEAWLVAILGEPTSHSWVDGVENTRVFRYATMEQSSGLSSLLSGRSGRTTSVTYFIISDGIVTRYWADRSKEFSMFGKPVESENAKQAEAASE